MDAATGSGPGLMEEYDLMKQAKYRVYMQNIDKALKNFEYSSEWADLISALGKLNKVISSYSQYQIIPRRIKISKRLAQCMHPALPSGVHLKALESYDVIFSNTGVERLASELFIYSAGLFPLLGYAAMNVRPSLLGIYEKYFVPLGERLRPALSGFLSGVLPGLEAGLDHFERTNSLLGKVCTAVSPVYFYTCLWECVATNSSIRLPAITYVLDHFNKRLGMAEQTYLMGKNVELMMSGLCACLNDPVILVQRNTLEFLLLGFPLHTNLLVRNDLIKLVTNALNTILRRDMSLNRRLYSWLLGTEVLNSNRNLMEADLSETVSLNSTSTGLGSTSTTETSMITIRSCNISYFEQYSKQILIKGLKMTLKNSLKVETKIDLRPYRILISLLDKIEIGPVVLDDILCDVIRTISLSNSNIDVIKSANLLFATFDPSYIWNFMTNLYESASKQDDSKRKLVALDKFTPEVDSGEPSLVEVCYLTEFLLETISLEMYNDTTRVYLPRVLFAITKILTIYSKNLSEDEVTASLQLCDKIVSRVQPMIIAPSKIQPIDTKSNKIEVVPVVTFEETSNGLEKSKSDSKLNQSLLDDEPIKRSNSNQSMGKKSPKKTKKSKSYSKLLELDKEICSDTGQLQVSSSHMSTPNLDIDSDKSKIKKKLSPTAKLKNKLKRNTENIEDSDEKSLPDTGSNRSSSHVETGEVATENPQMEEESLNEAALKEYTVLEKCIKQYEIFFQIYLSSKLLNISSTSSKIEITENSRFGISSSVSKSDIFENGAKTPEVFDDGKKKQNYFLNDNLIEDNNTENVQQIDQLFETLKIKENCRLEKLHSLLNQTISEKQEDRKLKFVENEGKANQSDNEKMINRLINLKVSESLKRSIKAASKLLVEMSTFPSYNQNQTMDYGELEIPTWLKVLALAAAYTKSDKELQISTIHTLFELISLLKSQIEHSTKPGVQFVVVLPLLRFGHISYIESKTKIFQVLISCLWDFLDDKSGDLSQICSLLYQLHQSLDSGLVESVIDNRIENAHLIWSAGSCQLEPQNRLDAYKVERLSCNRIMVRCGGGQGLEATSYLTEKQSSGFKKFELLWHLGRDLQNSKSFEHILLKIYDNLALAQHVSIRTFVVKWLKESFLRGDLGRLLKPLLRIMLCPNTKRLSISNVHLLKKKNKKSENQAFDDKMADEDAAADIMIEKDVYAVSSEDGNVRYHLESTGKKRSPIRTLQKKFFGVTLGAKAQQKNTSYIGESPSLHASAIASSMETNVNNISLIINPLERSEFEGIEQECLSKSAPTSINEALCDAPTGENYNQSKRYSDSSSEYSSACLTDLSETSNDGCSDEEKKPPVQAINGVILPIKKFTGGLDKDLLNEHDRIKNRKTYYLQKSEQLLDKVEATMIEVSEGAVDISSCTTAEEYFNDEKEPMDEQVIESVLQEILDNALENNEVEIEDIFMELKTPEESKQDQEFLPESIPTPEPKVTDIDPEVEQRPSSVNENDKPQLVRRRHKREHKIINEQQLQQGKLNLEILRKNKDNDLMDEFMLGKSKDKLHAFHSHVLLYYGCYDTKQVLYSFETIRNLILSCDCKLFMCLSITTAVTNNQLKQLLMRHRKSIFGKGFTGSLSSDFSNAYRGVMYLEVLITLCLYYARSYFQIPNDNENMESEEEDEESYQMSHQVPKPEDIVGNCKIQLASIELLTMIFNELIDIVKEMGKGLASFVADLLAKCKVQKVILHCMLTSVHHFTMKNGTTLAEKVLNFNDPTEEKMHLEAIQVQLLRLLHSVIKLEYETIFQKGDEMSVKEQSMAANSGTLSHSPTRPSPIASVATTIKYVAGMPISQQPMFLTAILNALQAENLKHLHRNWTDLVTSSLNCFTFGSLTNIVISIIHQICTNIDKITKSGPAHQIPPDYCASLLESLTVICHYCLLDNTQQVSLSNIINPQNFNLGAHNSSSGLSYNNILNFLATSSSQLIESLPKLNSQQMTTRNRVLSHLPRIIASVALLWETEVGQSRLVKQQLLEFLSPISLHHGCNFLAAISVAWQERGKVYKMSHDDSKSTASCKYLPQACSEQLSLVKLVSGIRIMPMDSYVQTLHSVIRSPPEIYRPPPGLVLDVSALELFYFYMKTAPAPQLADCWSSLLALLKDGLALAPPAQFVLLSILNEFVQRCPQMPFQDKKDLRDLHDITSRLVDALSVVAGSCLEQTTWLRRNLAVKDDEQKAGHLLPLGNQQYSVQAQSILACILAPLLDVAYGSQEKDKVIQIVTTLMVNIVPYLKNHTTRNIPSFYACSNLLSSLSSYQYTRKAWRKDVLDLLLDPVFFQMDSTCLPFWKLILDSLMTYDNTTFRDLMNRLSIAQTGSLNIFTSKEQEYEQRALLLKRLAFVIFCSEKDQYHKYMPEIQEQLANSLRLPSVVPSMQASVFLCFRVLLLRMSPDHVTSLWPIIIAEMVQVFLAIEQELMTDTEEFSQHIRMLSGLDTAWVTNTNNGLHSHGHPMWRSVQLETAKLLELGCVLPATNLPHFQMYRWAFVGSQHDYCSSDIVNGGTEHHHQTPASLSVFIPHVTRIARLMDFRYTSHSPTQNQQKSSHLVLTCQSIANLQDLYSFFSTLCIRWPAPHHYVFDPEKDMKNCLTEIEHILSLDFLEKMPSLVTAR